MEYELHLYISLQPSDKADFFLPELPIMPPETPWWGQGAVLTEEEYAKYFPDGYQTGEGIFNLLKDLYNTKEPTFV